MTEKEEKTIIFKNHFRNGRPMDKEQYFLIWCLEAMKRNKDVSGCVVYNKLRACGALDYILKFYNTIHSEGEHAIIQDLEEFCRVRGVVI